MRPVSGAEWRQLITRFQPGDFERLKIKAHADQLTMQSIVEELVRAYIRNDKYIMKLLEPFEKVKRKKSSAITDGEQRKIIEQLERESPLQDIVIQENQ